LVVAIRMVKVAWLAEILGISCLFSSISSALDPGEQAKILIKCTAKMRPIW